MTKPRCWIKVDHIGGLFQTGFVARRKWFRRAVGIQRQDRPVIGGEEPASGPASGHNWPAMLAERASMGIAHVYKQVTVLAAATLLLSLPLGGCASSTAGSSLMDARAEVPAPPQTRAYLPVEVLPPEREKPAMTPDERSKLQKDLIAARDRQTATGKKPKGPAQVEPLKP